MKTIKTILWGAVTLLALSACSSYLDVEPTDKITAESLFSTEGGIEAYLADLYYKMPIEDFTFFPLQGFHFNPGDANNSGVFSWCNTDDCVHGEQQAGGNDVDYTWWAPAWELNNNVNSFFGYIDGLSSISEASKNTLYGEAWFIRGQLYFALARRYGGVPIIEKVGDLTDSTTLYIPRSTEVATWDYVLDCFQKAADLLGDGNADKTRASKWSALAYKSRAALHAASVGKYWDQAPLSGDAVSQSLVGGFTTHDVQRYYKACIDACAEIINSGRFSLYKPNPASPVEATENYAKIFSDPSSAMEEVIFLRIFNKVGVGYGHNVDNWCNPAQTAGPWPHPGRSNPSLEFAENFETYSHPGQSSKFVTYAGDNFNYNGYNAQNRYIQFDSPLEIFADKDARLAATTILPGSIWKNTKIVIQGGVIQTNGQPVIDVDAKIGDTYIGADGSVNYAFGGSAQAFFSGFSTNAGNNTRTGFGFRKYLDPDYQAPGAIWNQSTTDFIDMRYAEILLNYAEAYAESGQGDAALAKQCLNATRHRAAHTTDLEPTLENILRERRAELCLGNTRTWDLVRRRQYHKIFDNYRRGALVPVLDLRTMKYIFVRQYVPNTTGQTWYPRRYYRPLSTASNGLVQNPQW